MPLKLSPHSVATFRHCKQQYKFQYIDKIGNQFFRSKPYFTMGNHVHATLKDFFSMVPVESRTLEASEQLLHKNWQKCRWGFRNAEDEKRWVEKAKGQLERFLSSQDITVTPAMLEESLETQITVGVILRGRIDRVDRETDGSFHIIDYKTGNLPDDINWSQLQIYALMLSRKLAMPVRKASFHYLAPGVVCTTNFSSNELDQACWDLLVTANQIVTEKLFSPNPGEGCKRCDFKPICSAL